MKKQRAEETASFIRTIAGILFFIGMVLAIIIIFIATLSLFSQESTPMVRSLFKATGVALIIYGVLFILGDALIYALLCGFSVLVENSDKTAIEQALSKMADITPESPNDTQIDEKRKETHRKDSIQPSEDQYEFDVDDE
jgi:predicted membrane protein